MTPGKAAPNGETTIIEWSCLTRIFRPIHSPLKKILLKRGRPAMMYLCLFSVPRFVTCR